MSLRKFTTPGLIARTRLLANEPDQDRFDDEEVLEYLNDAQEYFAESVARLAAEDTLISTIASTQEYPLPEEVQRIFAVWYYDGSDWLRLNHMAYGEQAQHYTDEGTQPTNYYIRRNMIGLVPVPSASGSSNVKVDGMHWPAELTNVSTSYPFDDRAIFRPFHRLLSYYAVSQMMAADSKLDMQKHWEERFARGLARAKTILLRRISDPTAQRQLKPFGVGTRSAFADHGWGQVGTQNDDMGTDFTA